MTNRLGLAALLGLAAASPVRAQQGLRSGQALGELPALPTAAAGASLNFGPFFSPSGSVAGMESAQVHLQTPAPAPELSADHATPAPEAPLAQAEANLSALAQEPAVKAAAERGGKPADAQSFHALYDKKASGVSLADAVAGDEGLRAPAALLPHAGSLIATGHIPSPAPKGPQEDSWLSKTSADLRALAASVALGASLAIADGFAFPKAVLRAARGVAAGVSAAVAIVVMGNILVAMIAAGGIVIGSVPVGFLAWLAPATTAKLLSAAGVVLAGAYSIYMGYILAASLYHGIKTGYARGFRAGLREGYYRPYEQL